MLGAEQREFGTSCRSSQKKHSFGARRSSEYYPESDKQPLSQDTARRDMRPSNISLERHGWANELNDHRKTLRSRESKRKGISFEASIPDCILLGYITIQSLTFASKRASRRHGKTSQSTDAVKASIRSDSNLAGKENGLRQNHCGRRHGQVKLSEFEVERHIPTDALEDYRCRKVAVLISLKTNQIFVLGRGSRCGYIATEKAPAGTTFGARVQKFTRSSWGSRSGKDEVNCHCQSDKSRSSLTSGSGVIGKAMVMKRSSHGLWKRQAKLTSFC